MTQFEWLDRKRQQERAIALLEKLEHSEDYETSHVEADSILCELLFALGYEKVVKSYSKIKKWYS